MTHKYDELLIEGLSKLKELEFSNIPEADEIEHTFSDEYIKSKEKLLNKLGHSYWKYVNTVAKKVAVIIIAFIIAFSSLITVDAFREKIINFMYKIYNSFTQIYSNNILPPTDIGRYYSIKNIPNGFNKYLTNYQSPIKISTYWTSENIGFIMLTQANPFTSGQFNSEHGELSERIINDTPCLICKDPNLYYCYWEFDGYRFELIYPIDLGEEFMSEVVGNLVEIDPAELEN